jgi:hypothetical protein
MNRALHKRYVDYREKHVYFGHPFGKNTPVLGPEDFARAEAELDALKAKAKARTAGDEDRLLELMTLLLLD